MYLNNNDEIIRTWVTAKFGRGKFQALNAYTRKEERLKMNDLSNSKYIIKMKTK